MYFQWLHGPGATRIIYIIFGCLVGAFCGAVIAALFENFPNNLLSCVLDGSLIGGFAGWFWWDSERESTISIVERVA